MILKKVLSVLLWLLLVGMPALNAQTGGACIEGAVVSTRSGATSIDICQGDGLPDIFRFKTEPAAMPFAYLITDENNVILGVSTSNIINLEGYPVGTLRVWAFSYLGFITAQIGQSATAGSLAQICSALSANFVTVNSVNPQGGTVSTLQGATSAFACVDNTGSAIVSFTSSNAGPNYSFVVTNDANIIVGVAVSGSFDFGTVPPGNYRVWGVAHAGALNATVGANITTTPLSNQCFGLSSNFVRVLRANADGGTVRTISGAAEIRFCRLQDATSVGLTADQAAPANYAYILTNPSNIVVAVLSSNTFNPTGLAPGDYRIWGVSYTGNLLVQAGQNVATATLADGCFDSSDNFIPVILQDVRGGEIAVVGGAPGTLCVGNDDADVLDFIAVGQGGGSYAWLVTDHAGQTVLNSSTTGSIDFNTFDAGRVLVWGLSYTGTLSVQPGQSVASLLQSLQCADLSSNSIALTLIRTSGGNVSLVGGATSINICTADGRSDELNFETDSDADEAYAFVVTDASNNIIAFSPSGVVDFEGAGVGVARVWGLSYSGDLIAAIGSNAATTTLSNGCFDLSDNFVTINLLRAKGGRVSIEGGGMFASLCVNDGVADMVTFSNNSGFAPNYAYLVTDEDNKVLLVSNSEMINFEGTGAGLVRVWGVAYTGNLSVEPGDNAAEVALSTECYELSENFVLIRKETVNGGRVQTLLGQTSLEFCGGDGFPDNVVYFSNTQALGDYVFLITDANNVVLVVNPLNTIDFENFGSGVFRIWGLSYTGTLLAEVGDIAPSAQLAEQCFALSENFIEVRVTAVDGGQISLQNGDDFFRACGGDGVEDIPLVTSTANDPQVAYTWLLTDEFNDIIAVSNTANFDLDGFAPGEYRIWGLGYAGNLLAAPGQNAGSTALADDCFSLSLNFIEVVVDITLGGTIADENGRDTIAVCIGDGSDSAATFETTGQSTEEYIYVLTDEENRIVRLSNGNSILFDEDLPHGVYRVWGLAYSGTLIAQLGDDADEAELSDGCYSLSENFVPVLVGSPDGGFLTFDNGDTEYIICPDDNVADVLTFNTNSTATQFYVYLITDANNTILDIITGNEYNFDIAGYDEIRVWGLSYAGNLLADIGMMIEPDTPLSDECFELSDEALRVLRQTPDGGRITLVDGSTSISSCAGAQSDELFFVNDTDFVGNYVFVITSTSNVILDFATGNSYDFSALSNDTLRVWGLAYTGNVLAAIGDDAATTELTDGCYDLSDNFITVFRANPVGGLLVTPDGQTQYLRCAGDDDPDLITFTVQGASNAPYVFLITDDNNYLIGLSTQPRIDLDNAINGVFRVYGLSYTGVFQLFPGDSIFGPIPAASGCFQFSENFIEINNVRVNGGILSGSDNRTVFYTCPADGVPDVITFSNNSNAPNATYAYLFTTEDNIITGLTFQNSFNFDIAGVGVTRIWGVSYTGNFTATFGDNAATAMLSDQCFDLSDNFITVIRDVPSGGMVSVAGGSASIVFCNGIDNPIVQINTSSASLAAYIYVLTDAFNDILAFSANGQFDLSSLAPGEYRIWGISYTGTLNLNTQNLLDVSLGSSCLEISANFIAVTVTPPVVGGTLRANGDLTNITFCPADGIPDVVEVSTDSPTPADQYRLVVTNVSGLVFIPDLMGNAIDFDGAGTGEYRIYAIAFTGNYLVDIGMNINTATLATGCSQVSSNFIRITSAEADGGDVTTTQGQTFLLLDTNDGEPDSVSFVNSGTPLLPYIYILTDDQNIVLEYLNGNIYNFEGRQEQTLHVWGLSYFGTAPTATGVPINSLASPQTCSDLSNTYVTISTLPPFSPDDEGQAAALRATVQPNPAAERVTVNVWSKDNNGAPIHILLLDGAGRLRMQYRIEKAADFQQVELDISQLENGVYTVQLRSEKEANTLRLVKSRP